MGVICLGDNVPTPLEYVPPIDAECMHSVLSINAVVQSSAKFDNKRLVMFSTSHLQ